MDLLAWQVCPTRTALELPLEPNVRLLTLGNLGVLYMTTSKIEEALQYIDQGLHLADKNAMERKSVSSHAEHGNDGDVLPSNLEQGRYCGFNIFLLSPIL